MSFTEDETKQALNYAYNGAMFMYRAGENLSSELIQGGPASVGLPKWLEIMMIKREWISLDSDTVIKYCTKTLDKRNTYALDNSDIKAIPEPLNLLKIK